MRSVLRKTIVLTCLFWLLAAGVAANSKRPLVVFVSGDHEYGSESTFPILAAELEKHYGFETRVLKSFPDENSEENIPGLEALDKADLAVFFLRWRRLPTEQLKHIEAYLKSGKPIVAFRTSTHAFNYPKGDPLESWNRYAPEFIGGPPGWGNGHFHYGHLSSTDVTRLPSAQSNPILTGVPEKFHVSSWLYHVLPNYPPRDAVLLLNGHAVNPDRAAIDNPVAWTWKNKYGSKVFVTTLGHPDDFNVEGMQRLVINAIHWAAGKKVPKKWAGPMTFNVKYHGIRKTR